MDENQNVRCEQKWWNCVEEQGPKMSHALLWIVPKCPTWAGADAETQKCTKVTDHHMNVRSTGIVTSQETETPRFTTVVLRNVLWRWRRCFLVRGLLLLNAYGVFLSICGTFNLVGVTGRQTCRLTPGVLPSSSFNNSSTAAARRTRIRLELQATT